MEFENGRKVKKKHPQTGFPILSVKEGLFVFRPSEILSLIQVVPDLTVDGRYMENTDWLI